VENLRVQKQYKGVLAECMYSSTHFCPSNRWRPVVNFTTRLLSLPGKEPLVPIG